MQTRNLIRSDNPIVFKSDNLDALNEAFSTLLETLEENSDKFNLTDEELKELKESIKKAYLERKLNIYLNNKITKFTNRFNRSLSYYVSNNFLPSPSKDPSSSLFYLKHNSLVHNEQ